MQKPFERGVALLHSFWYEEAEKEFAQIAADDPHCSMAHWGVAMSLWHQLWNQPDAGVIEHGLNEVHQAKTTDGHATPREKAYIAAIAAFYSESKKLDHEARAKAYSDAMKKVYEPIPTITKPPSFTRSRCLPPSRTTMPRSPIAKPPPRFSKNSLPSSPIIPAWLTI